MMVCPAVGLKCRVPYPLAGWVLVCGGEALDAVVPNVRLEMKIIIIILITKC